MDISDIKQNVQSKNLNFGWGHLSPKLGAWAPVFRGLCRDLKGAHNPERTVAISVAVTEKIEFEKNNLTPSSGETGRGRGPMSRMWGRVWGICNL